MNNKFTKYDKIFLTLIIVAVLFMGIGYAKIGSIDLNINGQFLAHAPEVVFISSVDYVSNSNADKGNSKIIECYDTMMNSNMVLSKTEGKSSITYKVTVFNNTNVDHYYNKVVYDPEVNFYSNSNITFKLDGILRGDKLASGATTSFNITFYYLNETLPDTTVTDYNVLKSYLNFVFTPANELVTYNISDSPALLVKNTLTSGDIKSQGASKVVGTIGDNYKIDPEKGLYINDDSDSSNYWMFFSYVEEDGYTSSLNKDHLYYIRVKNRIISKSGSSKFIFRFSNALHINGNHYGIAISLSNINSVVSDDYVLLSSLTKPMLTKSVTVDNLIYESDYVDSIQFGSGNVEITESYTKDFMFLDVTELFGAGNEPSKEWLDNNIIFDNDSISWFTEN